MAHDWDIVFDEGLEAREDSYPLAVVVEGDRIVSFGSGADHLLTREGALITRREEQVTGYFGMSTSDAVVAVTPADEGLRFALRTISTTDLSLSSTVDAPTENLASLGTAFGLEGDSLAVVWEAKPGAFRVDQYMVGAKDLVSSVPLAEGSVSGVCEWRALRRGDLMLFASPQGESSDRLIRADLTTGELVVLEPPIPGVEARFGMIAQGNGRAFYVGTANDMTHIREIDVATWEYIGEPRATNLLSDYAISVWGEYLVWIGGGEVTAVPLAEPSAPALTGDVTLEPPDHINSAVPMAMVAQGEDAYVVYQSYIGGGPSRLHLRKLTYPPTVLPPL